jgi:hypothetical protein
VEVIMLGPVTNQAVSFGGNAISQVAKNLPTLLGGGAAVGGTALATGTTTIGGILSAIGSGAAAVASVAGTVVASPALPIIAGVVAAGYVAKKVLEEEKQPKN